LKRQEKVENSKVRSTVREMKMWQCGIVNEQTDEETNK
jgi:hypothetical protein